MAQRCFGSLGQTKWIYKIGKIAIIDVSKYIGSLYNPRGGRSHICGLSERDLETAAERR